MPQSASSSCIGAALARIALVLAALAVVSALAACGGAGSPTSAAAERSKEQADEAKLARFGKCLREHGIEAKTSSQGPGRGGFAIGVKGVGGQAKMEAAQRACRRFRPAAQKVNLSPQQKIAAQEGVLKFAKCMREHGIDVHASTAGGGAQIQIRAKPGGAGPNPESPAFEAAQKACQRLLPFKGHPPGGAPGAEHSTSGGPGSESGAAASAGG